MKVNFILWLFCLPIVSIAQVINCDTIILNSQSEVNSFGSIDCDSIGSLIISGEDIFTLDGIEGASIYSSLDIISNPNLENIEAISFLNILNRDSVRIEITNNPLLNSCSVDLLCEYISSVSPVFVEFNGEACSYIEILKSCDNEISDESTVLYKQGFETWDDIAPPNWPMQHF